MTLRLGEAAAVEAVEIAGKCLDYHGLRAIPTAPTALLLLPASDIPAQRAESLGTRRNNGLKWLNSSRER